MKRICIFLCSNQTYVECVTKNLFGSDKPWPMELKRCLRFGRPIQKAQTELFVLHGVEDTRSKFV